MSWYYEAHADSAPAAKHHFNEFVAGNSHIPQMVTDHVRAQLDRLIDVREVQLAKSPTLAPEVVFVHSSGSVNDSSMTVKTEVYTRALRTMPAPVAKEPETA